MSASMKVQLILHLESWSTAAHDIVKHVTAAYAHSSFLPKTGMYKRIVELHTKYVSHAPLILLTGLAKMQ